MNKEINARIKHTIDTEENWLANNPVLLDGELVYSKIDNEVREKLGDGETTYENLPFRDEAIKEYVDNSNPIIYMNLEDMTNSWLDITKNTYVIGISNGGMTENVTLTESYSTWNTYSYMGIGIDGRFYTFSWDYDNNKMKYESSSYLNSTNPYMSGTFYVGSTHSTINTTNQQLKLSGENGINVSDKVISNLAAGEEDTDAVNLSQLNEVKNSIPTDYIKTIKVNGTEQTLDENKAVDITIEEPDLSGYLPLTGGELSGETLLVTNINNDASFKAGLSFVKTSENAIYSIPTIEAQMVYDGNRASMGMGILEGFVLYFAMNGIIEDVIMFNPDNENNKIDLDAINASNKQNMPFSLNVIAPTSDIQAANKKYVDDSIVEKLSSVLSKTNYEITLGTAWSGDAAPYTQSVAVEGILATDNPYITPIYSDTLATAIAEQEAWNCVSKAETTAGAIIFTCFADKPTMAISLQIEVVR